MNSWKTLGLDGMHVTFHQQFWEIVQLEVISHITDLFIGTKEIEPFNSTVIHLIPKKTHPWYPSYLKPIVLCNVSYKILAKLWANRIQHLLGYIVNPAQRRFVSSSGTIDNVVVFELIYCILNKNTRLWSATHILAIKMDMSKAYDRISLEYLEFMLNKFNFPIKFIQLIIRYVPTVWVCISCNGELTQAFKPSHGLS